MKLETLNDFEEIYIEGNRLVRKNEIRKGAIKWILEGRESLGKQKQGTPQYISMEIILFGITQFIKDFLNVTEENIR